MAKGRTRLRLWLESARAVDDVQQRLAAREAAEVLGAQAGDERVARRVEAADVPEDQPPALAGGTATTDSR